MVEEEYWLDKRWTKCRITLMAYLRKEQHLKILSESIRKNRSDEPDKRISDDDWNKYIDEVCNDLDRSMNKLRSFNPENEKADLYAVLVTLLGFHAKMKSVFDSAQNYIVRMEIPSVLIARSLAEMKREYLPGSPHRQKMWGTIDMISRELFRRPKLIGARSLQASRGRCEPAHMREVANEVLKRHGRNKHLVAAAENIEDYFLEFCGDCVEADLYAGGKARDFLDANAAAKIETLPDVTSMIEIVRLCLGKLTEEQQQIMRYHHEISDNYEQRDMQKSFETKSAFCEHIGIKRDRYYDQRARAERLMRDCVELHYGNQDNVVEVLR